MSMEALMEPLQDFKLSVPNTEEYQQFFARMAYVKCSGSAADPLERKWLTVQPFKQYYWEDVCCYEPILKIVIIEQPSIPMLIVGGISK